MPPTACIKTDFHQNIFIRTTEGLPPKKRIYLEISKAAPSNSRHTTFEGLERFFSHKRTTSNATVAIFDSLQRMRQSVLIQIE